ncbi:hypothetical protein DVH24_032220 [Malus domestica]|uniref:Serine-threonine/tyrosine-protein kinase catalytic domain-containing protein n=1 Tax=Malus domestica TaxID=3750 RepID=A0A498J7T2_MALDO|nr:hypothetical protein DVH24_032220 [Malus domestica]
MRSGYMSPKYVRYGHFSEKLDVFSFEGLLLQIVSGKKNAAFYCFEHSPTLAGWAWELWKEGREMEVIDESVRETCRLDEVLRCIHTGFLCVQETPTDRPTMSLFFPQCSHHEFARKSIGIRRVITTSSFIQTLQGFNYTLLELFVCFMFLPVQTKPTILQMQA